MGKLKGVAKIELKNIETGEVKTQIEENLVTIAVPEILKHNPFGANKAYPSAAQLMGGIMLFDEELEENVNNTKIPKIPQAWAGNTVNSTGGTKRGSMNMNASTANPDGMTFVWEWTTSQANGYYSSIALTNPYICNYDGFSGKNPLRLMNNDRIGLKNADQVGDVIYKVDHENGLLYAIRGIDAFNIEFNVYSRGIYKLHLWQSSIKENTDVPNELTNGVYNKLKFSKTVTVGESLWRGLTTSHNNHESSHWTSATYTNGMLYLFSIVSHSNSNGNNKILITKIDDSNLLNDEITVTQEYIDLSGILTDPATIGSAIHCYKYATGSANFINNDVLCFNYPYLYVKTKGAKTVQAILKVNITDLTDIKEIWRTGTSEVMSTLSDMMGGGIKLKNFFIDTAAGATWSGQDEIGIDLDTDEIFKVNGRGDKWLNSRMAAVVSIDDYYIMQYEVPQTGATACVYLNPYYLATINNIEPFTKSSAQTLTITYTLTEI